MWYILISKGDNKFYSFLLVGFWDIHSLVNTKNAFTKTILIYFLLFHFTDKQQVTNYIALYKKQWLQNTFKHFISLWSCKLIHTCLSNLYTIQVLSNIHFYSEWNVLSFCLGDGSCFCFNVWDPSIPIYLNVSLVLKKQHHVFFKTLPRFNKTSKI